MRTSTIKHVAFNVPETENIRFVSLQPLKQSFRGDAAKPELIPTGNPHQIYLSPWRQPPLHHLPHLPRLTSVNVPLSRTELFAQPTAEEGSQRLRQPPWKCYKWVAQAEERGQKIVPVCMCELQTKHCASNTSDWVTGISNKSLTVTNTKLQT